MAAMILLAMSIFLALAITTTIVVGYEVLVYYHHEIAIICGIALFLRLLHQPELRYLDITALGIGVFLACGRIGCLFAGCCHGRPFRFGIRYGARRAAAGFAAHYVGIPLFPVQAAESFLAFCIVAAGTEMIFRGSAPGSTFAFYVVLYGCMRFYLEFSRGDPDRPYLYGFSEAQWTSVILMSLAVFGEAFGRLPFRPWHFAMTALVVTSMATVAIERRFRRAPTHRFFHPRHVRELAQAIRSAVTAPGAPVQVGRTSLGIQVSGGEIRTPDERRIYYAVSRNSGTMNAASARALAKLICVLRHPGADFEVINGKGSVFHILILNRMYEIVQNPG